MVRTVHMAATVRMAATVHMAVTAVMVRMAAMAATVVGKFSRQTARFVDLNKSVSIYLRNGDISV